MEGTSSLIVELILVCAFIYFTCGHSCPLQQELSAKFTVGIHRNQTGHWITKVWIDHGVENKSVKTSPWVVYAERNPVSFNGVELLQLAATLTEPPPRAGPGYELHPGVGYYKVHSDLKTWHEALRICAEEGGHLAIINSEKESEILKSIFSPVAAKENVLWAYIGFHDLYVEGQYLTIFGEPLSSTGFTRWWAKGQPDNDRGIDKTAGEDCGTMHINGGLNDLHCSELVPFICEQELW